MLTASRLGFPRNLRQKARGFGPARKLVGIGQQGLEQRSGLGGFA
jgi:hypothetical protein